MNFFLGGDFKIQQSWEKRSNDSRNSKSRQRPKSRANLKNNNSALLNAGKNMFQPVYQPSTDLLDDDVTKKILKDFAAEIPPLPSTAKSQKKIPLNDNDISKKGVGLPPKVQKGPISAGDESLIGSMAARLKQVQLTAKNQRQEIKQKTQMIEKLKTQNQFLRGLRSDSSKVLKDMQDLKNENEALQKKIKQMQDYLKKYGVKWVGYNVEGKLDHESLKNDIKKPKFNYRMPAQIEIGTIQRRVQQLNAGLHSQGMGTQVYSENGVHKFRKAQPLPIAFFGNGIAIKGFKFFTYKSKQSLQILSDLVDGYFPYVLKHKYPNGVFLNVIDKISLKYDEKMGGDSQDKVVKFDQMDAKDFLPPSKQEFLNKLPKQVIKNGKVIEIRKAIEKKLNGEPQTIAQQDEESHPECETTEDGTMIFLSTCYRKVKSNEVTEEQICTLKIRTDSGKVCVLHVEKQVVIKEVYTWMDKVVGQKKRYKLMGNYPRRIYEKDEKENLQSLGLFPNAMLHVHVQEKTSN